MTIASIVTDVMVGFLHRPIISNREAIAVNQRWAGHPGRLVKSIEKTLPIQYPHALECDGSATQTDWILGPVTSNSTRRIYSKSAKLCVDAWMHEPLVMEPCTGNASQQFVYDEKVGTIKAPNYPANNGQLDGCFDIMSKVGPKMQLTKCYDAPNDKFAFEKSTILGDIDVTAWADKGGADPYPKRCMQVQNGTAVEAMVIAKPQPGGAMAVFVFNAGVRDDRGQIVPGANISTTLHLATDLLLPTGANEVYSVRDLWRHKELPRVMAPDYIWKTGDIAERDSIFVLISPLASASTFR